MPANPGIALLLYAKRKEEEDMIFQRWLVAGQFEMSFEEFKQKLTKPRLKPDEEVLKDVESIMASWEAI